MLAAVVFQTPVCKRLANGLMLAFRRYHSCDAQKMYQ